MNELFYSDQPPGEIFNIPPEEARHLIRVLRFVSGDEIHITDGKGTLYTAVLENTGYESCTARIKSSVREFRKRPYNLHVAIAPTKNMDRFEWFLEKSTELGIDTIIPMICRRSERRDVRPERLNKILLSAMKQSFQAYLPKLLPAMTFGEVLNRTHEKKFICHLEETEPVSLKDACPRAADTLFLIGPEGDFEETEVTQAIDAGFQCVSLGPTRLRTETAGVAVCAYISYLNQ